MNICVTAEAVGAGCSETSLNDDVLRQICGIPDKTPQITPEWMVRLRMVPGLLEPQRPRPNLQLESALTLLASLLGQLKRFNPVHLPFGYEGPVISPDGWIDRAVLETVGKQIVGLRWCNLSAQAVANAVHDAVSESVHLGFLAEKAYDAWRPGMRSGSGWRSAVTATPYGVMKACSVTEPRLERPKIPTETSSPHRVETPQRMPGKKGGKIGESFVEPTPAPEAIVNRSPPTRLTDARDGQPERGDACGNVSVPTNGEAPGDNPIGAWNSACQQLEDVRLIGEYAQATPESLLAQCNRMIDCIAGFDTVLLCSPAQAEQQARMLGDDWLVGFKRVLEILLLAAVSRKIDLGRFKELTSTAFSLWTGLLDSTAAAEAIQGLFSPGIAQLFDLKRALMIELAPVRGETTTSELLARNPRAQPRRGTRTANIEKLEKELEKHLLTARDHAHSLRDRGCEAVLLPRPTQKELAQRTGLSNSDVSRCLRDPRATVLKILWETADSLEAVMSYQRRR